MYIWGFDKFNHERFGGEFINTKERINQILDEYDKPYNEGIKLFYHHLDADGEITPDECVILLKSFGKVDPEKFRKSKKDDYEFVLKGFDKWKKMMSYAIENNKNIIFD